VAQRRTLVRTFIDHLGAGAASGLFEDGLQFTMAAESQQLTYIMGFPRVIEQGKLVRLWGVARDVRSWPHSTSGCAKSRSD